MDYKAKFATEGTFAPDNLIASIAEDLRANGITILNVMA